MYGGINTINMSKYNNNFFKILILSIIFYSLSAFTTEKTTIYNCTGLSQFELIGSSGVKEEVKIKEYKFIDGSLHDLNTIGCEWGNNNIKCESNFLNVRKLNINLENNEVSDYLSGNKGFGVYVENFKGKCKLVN
jgi:hypothetical protein